MKSPLSKTNNTEIIYKQRPLPLFQNKVYTEQSHAIQAQMTEVILAKCKDTGFVFSADFDINRLNYDENYQNEQSNSPYFQSHLNNVIDFLTEHQKLQGKVLEIGCGKGYFLNMLDERGIDIQGIDPTYEGESPLIIKDYYSKDYAYLNADLIILRHTLEHIPEPLDFIQMIAEANEYRGKIYIEIPTFEWIAAHGAVEDVFYEHCNYFTRNTAALLFEDSIIQHTFEGQYLAILADLKSVKKNIHKTNPIEEYEFDFEKTISKYAALLKKNSDMAIWGAGAKGSTFLNLMDPKRELIKAVIDINPKKQQKFIGGSGHPIISPDEIKQFGIRHILIMNSNYISEIKNMVNDPEVSFDLIDG